MVPTYSYVFSVPIRVLSKKNSKVKLIEINLNDPKLKMYLQLLSVMVERIAPRPVM